ncbi:MAG: SUMF1/EgtB/PvdO family nonheme iron enzyme [Myxococcota bacterium]
MSQETQVTCPECGNEQSSTAPFCENCGYRIRRTDTVKEGHEAITPEILSEARRKASEARKKNRRPEASPSSDASKPSNSSHDKKTVHDVPAIGPEDNPQAPANQRKGSQTYVEGLSRVSKDAAPDSDDDGASAAPASTSRTFEQPPRQNGPSLVVWGTVWLSLTAIAVLAVYFVMANNGKAEGPPQSATGPSQKIQITEGPFLRGLDGEVRSFILQMCQKVEEDPDENCDQDKLLKGEFPEKTVDLPAYEIDSKEVTNASYEACVAADACSPVDYKECDVWTHQGLQVALRVPKVMRESTRPVVCVTRADAKNYCEWAGGSLPGADQWEKAARGTKGRLFPWGDSWSSDLANWGEMDIARTYIVGELDGYEWTAPPGNFPKGKSEFGIYDAAGNVAEWTDTDDELKGEARGGSWTSTPFDLRVTKRLFLDADDRRTDVGFRCVY